ncbi:MAG TPA: OB-fold domain-containing protein, partial [Ilumatobacteraceae bacterium]
MPDEARPLPLVDDLNAFYWRAGRDGVLRFQQCHGCAALLHPPQPICRYCHSQDLGVAEVSGRGVVVAATLNHQLWDPAFPPPFVVASVAIDEDPRVRVITNIVDAAAGDVVVGQRVRVCFEHVEDVWLPMFMRERIDGEPVAAQLPDDDIAPGDHARRIRPMVRLDKFEDRVAITGIGMSAVGR